MALEVESFICMFILSLVALAACSKPPQVPCYFIFGDSLVDNGNNNDLSTDAKANFPPYGIDFPDGPTGRFTNGRNIADFIAEFLGFDKYIQPYATAKHELNLRGLNYASGSAGIRYETGQHMGERFSLQDQLVHHGITVVRLKLFFGNSKLAEDHLSKCLYTVGMGSNDYINNYLLPQFYHTSRFYTLHQYTTLLLDQYSQQLKELHMKYRARKVGVFGVGYIGCTPAEISIHGADESSCVDMINSAAISFNQQLRNILADLNNAFSDAKFIYIEPPLGYVGPRISNTPCCPISRTVAKGQCAPTTIPCSNRTDYVFWDAFHPTETVILADALNAYSTMARLFTTTSTVNTPTPTTELLGFGDEHVSV